MNPFVNPMIHVEAKGTLAITSGWMGYPLIQNLHGSLRILTSNNPPWDKKTKCPWRKNKKHNIN